MKCRMVNRKNVHVSTFSRDFSILHYKRIKIIWQKEALNQGDQTNLEIQQWAMDGEQSTLVLTATCKRE